MATPAAVLSILIKADTKSAQASLLKANRSLKTTATRMDDTDKAARRSKRGFATLSAAAYGAAGGVVLLGLAGKKAFREYEEAEKATKQTRAVLKSTGDAAKVTAAEIENLAQKLSLKSGIDDEAIQSAENLLLTFTKVRNEAGKNNDIFTEATGVITDMSVALGQDLKSSTIQVGKALQDPIKGLTALRRVGVNFNEQQSKRVEKWVEEGKTLKAQKFILRELNTEFAGSAKAQATGSEKLQVAWDNLFETIGKGFGPSVERAMEDLSGFIDRVSRILNNPKLTGEQKFNKIADMISEAVSKGLGKAADAAGRAAPKVAGAFLDAFMGANVWGKLAIGGTGGFLLKKLGVTGGIGKLLSGGKSTLGTLGIKMFKDRGSTPANPLFVADVTGGGGGGGKGGKGFVPKVLDFGKKVIPIVTKTGTVVGAVVAPWVIQDMIKPIKPGNVDEKGRPISPGKTPGAVNAPPTSPVARARAADKAIAQASRVKDEGASAAAAGMEQLNKRLKAVRQSIKALRDGALKDIGEIQSKAGQNFKKIADDIGLHTRKGRKAAADNFEAAATAIGKSVGKGRTSTKQAMNAIEGLMKSHSKAGKDRLTNNLVQAAQNIEKSMDAGKISTKKGTELIELYMVKALQGMGFTKKQALMVRKGQDPYTGKATGGSQNLTNKQRGGPINMGAPVGDSVPAMLERGEYVLNRNAVGKVGRRNLDALNFQNAARFQVGGMVRIPGDPDTTGGRDKVAASIAAEVGSFIKRYGIQVNYAYDPGGGHQSPGHNVSGTALDVGPNTTGWPGVNKAVAAATAAGKTVYYDGRFGSIALANHGEGNHAHIEWGVGGGVGGSAPGLELAPKLKRLMVDGPDSMLKATVQGALDVARSGANAVIGRANTLVSTATGDFSGADFAGGGDAASNRALGKRMAAAFGWTGAQWNALDKLWIGESGWINQMNQAGSGATGIPQALPGSKMASEGADWATNPATQIAWGLKYIKSSYGDPVNAYNTWLGRTPHWYQKGGPVGYAGDSLGTGTAPLLKGLLDRTVWSNSKVGRGSAAGVGILKGFDKASQLVFDLGTNDPDARTTHTSLLSASRAAGKRPLHFLTLLGGPDQAGKNKMFRAAASDGGHEYLTDYAKQYKGGRDSIGHPSSYGSRARMLAESIKRAGKATDHPNKPDPRGKLKKRKHLHGLQAPSIQALHNAVEGMRYGITEEGRLNARNHILDLIHGTGLSKSLVDKIDGLTEQSTILGDYADRAGQLTTEDAAGNVIPGVIAGRSEVDFLTDQLDVLARLRNRLVEAQEKLAARRKQIRELLETAQKHFDYYQKAVVAWGHVIRVQEKKLEELRKHPKKNKKQIEQTRNLIMALKPEQAKTVFTRDALKDKIIPALKGKHSGLGDSRSTMMDSLGEVQGVGSPLTQMATLPALGTLGGSIFGTQMRLRELKLPPQSLTDTAADTLTSDRDDLLRELGRLTLQRSAVEKLHEITLRDFPEFDRVGVPFGGKFHTGGIVPGPVGAEAATVLQGGEGVFTRDQMAAMGTPSVTINVAPGMEWLKQFISVEVGRSNRSVARNAGRGLPGQGGGRLT